MIKLRKMSERPLLDSERDALLAVARALKRASDAREFGHMDFLTACQRLDEALAALPEGWDR